MVLISYSRMARRAQTWLLTLIVAIASNVAITRANDARSALPNIVILFADDMGYGDLAILNPESKIPTPNLDQLAREGNAVQHFSSRKLGFA